MEAVKRLPRSLRTLEERGLEIKLTQNYGPHKKYYPFLESTDVFEMPLVTADDDFLYPKSWLSGLVGSFNGDCSAISCYRAHVLKIAGGAIAPYRSWGHCRTQKASFLNFAVGGSGCIYPPAFLRALKAAGRGFEQQCPRADDVWLHVNAIRARFMIKQIRRLPLSFPFLPETQDIGLLHSNVGLGQNDVQIRNTYTPTDVDTLNSCLSSRSAQTKHYGVCLIAPTAEGDDGQVNIGHPERSSLYPSRGPNTGSEHGGEKDLTKPV